MRNLTDFLLFVLLAIALAACQSGTLFGDNLLDEDNTQVQELDTLKVSSSSMLLDSVYTTNSTHLLAGTYLDPLMGAIRAQCFFNVDTFGVFAVENNENLRLDSLSLSLRYDYEYPATDHLQHLAVYSLAEALDEETLYFNDSPGPRTLRKIAIASFYTRATRDKRFSIRLPDELGQDLLKVAKGQDGWILDDVLLGLNLAQEGAVDNQSVLGFPADSVEIRLHYRDRRTGEAGSIKLSLQLGYRFNQLMSDRSNTALGKLTQVGVPLPATQSEQYSFIQTGVGICTKLDFPTLRNFRENRKISINLAYLDIQPVKTSYQGNDFQPLNQLYVYSPTHKNTLKQTYWYSNDANPVNVRRTVDPLTGNSNFRIYLTDYIHDIVNQDAEEYEGILLYSPVTSSGINEVGRLVLASQGLSREAVKLHVIFTVIK